MPNHVLNHPMYATCREIFQSSSSLVSKSHDNTRKNSPPRDITTKRVKPASVYLEKSDAPGYFRPVRAAGCAKRSRRWSRDPSSPWAVAWARATCREAGPKPPGSSGCPWPWSPGVYGFRRRRPGGRTRRAWRPCSRRNWPAPRCDSRQLWCSSRAIPACHLDDLRRCGVFFNNSKIVFFVLKGSWAIVYFQFCFFFFF